MNNEVFLRTVHHYSDVHIERFRVVLLFAIYRKKNEENKCKIGTKETSDNAFKYTEIPS